MLTIRRLSLEESDILIQGAAEKARQIDVPMCIAITDESGHLIKFSRMDGGKISSISIAIDKAFTGAVARRGTHIYNELCIPGKPTFGIHVSNEGHFSIIGGGLPVWVNGEIVGGIGVSSGSADQDQLCAEAGIEHFYKKTGLKQ
jgi:uncharacterized protein GlcG (DUF336 family)